MTARATTDRWTWTDDGPGQRVLSHPSRPGRVRLTRPGWWTLGEQASEDALAAVQHAGEQLAASVYDAPTDPYAARCRVLAALPHYAPYAGAFLGAARSIEGGGVSGPIALLSALVEAGEDPEDAGVPLGAAATAPARRASR